MADHFDSWLGRFSLGFCSGLGPSLGWSVDLSYWIVGFLVNSFGPVRFFGFFYWAAIFFLGRFFSIGAGPFLILFWVSRCWVVLPPVGLSWASYLDHYFILELYFAWIFGLLSSWLFHLASKFWASLAGLLWSVLSGLLTSTTGFVGNYFYLAGNYFFCLCFWWFDGPFDYPYWRQFPLGRLLDLLFCFWFSAGFAGSYFPAFGWSFLVDPFLLDVSAFCDFDLLRIMGKFNAKSGRLPLSLNLVDRLLLRTLLLHPHRRFYWRRTRW